MGPAGAVVVGGCLAQRIPGSFPAQGRRHEGRRQQAICGGDVTSGRGCRLGAGGRRGSEWQLSGPCRAACAQRGRQGWAGRPAAQAGVASGHSTRPAVR